MNEKNNSGAKIISLQIENVKKVKSITTSLNPGMNIIGGGNCQGKTTIADTIKWALQGNKYKPSNPKRNGSILDPNVEINLDNGYQVKISGKNSTVKVTDSLGRSAGITMLKSFISEFALDIPAFMSVNDNERLKMILKHFGVVDELELLKKEEGVIFEERRIIGVNRDNKKSAAASIEVDESFGFELKDIGDLIRKQQDILAINGENQRKRNEISKLVSDEKNITYQIQQKEKELEALKEQYHKISEDLLNARMSESEINDLSTEELEKQISDFDSFNSKVRANLEFTRIEEEAETYHKQYLEKTEKIEENRSKQKKILDSVIIPLEGLQITDSKILYNGNQWDCMSGAEQYRVAVAIVSAINPDAKLVLLDDMEKLDMKSLIEFSNWVEKIGLQIIAIRVSTGDECSIIIEDGEVVSSKIPTINNTKIEAKENITNSVNYGGGF